MERKGLIGKESQNHKGYTNLLYTALSNSFIHGDNLKMKISRLKKRSRQAENLKIYFNKKPRGEN